jgi:hypothetical protein
MAVVNIRSGIRRPIFVGRGNTPAHLNNVLLTQAKPTGLVEIEFRNNEGRYESRTKTNDLVEDILEIVLTDSATSIETLVTDLKNDPPWVVFQNNAGEWRLVGTKSHPCFVEATNSSGGNVATTTIRFSALRTPESFAVPFTLPNPAL